MDTSFCPTGVWIRGSSTVHDTPSVDDFSGRRARRVLVSGDIHTPQSLSLDLMNGYMYWVDRESGEPRIERARLDGSERQVFHRGTSHAVSYV